jgi:acetyl-CoA synthetase
MSEHKLYPVPDSLADAHISADDYAAMYRRSIDDRDAFFAEMATQFLDWDQPWSEVCSFDFTRGEANWFAGGRLNVSVNCIDRHLPARADQTAIIWEGDDAADDPHISYRQLHEEVGRLANALKARGVGRGDRVCLYMPMIPEAAYAMLACARIGAIHTVVFGGFSPEALKDRIQSASAARHHGRRGLRGGKTSAPEVQHRQSRPRRMPRGPQCIVVSSHRRRRRDAGGARRLLPRTHRYRRPTARLKPWTRGSPVHPLHLRLHRQTEGRAAHDRRLPPAGGLTFKYVFDYHDGEVYWCTADVGWVTGHSYIVYGPLANGATTLMFEGVPTYPGCGTLLGYRRQVEGRIFYTAPTAIRALHGHGRRLRDQVRAQQPAHPRVRSVSRSTRRPGSGTTTWSATRAAPSSTPGGRRKPAAF